MKLFSTLREPANGFTHFLGILFSFYVLFALLTRETPPVTQAHTITFIIYSFAMFLLFLSSTLYHWMPWDGEKLLILRKIDHIMIFVFIAASYTPICITTLEPEWGIPILVIVWLIALGGFFIKLFWLHAPRKLYTSIYLLMGWMVLFAILPLNESMPDGSMIWLGLEALFYTTGAIIYAIKKPDPYPGILGFHEIFHIFILLGAYAHFYLLLKFV